MNIKKVLKNLIPFSSFNTIRKALKPSEKFSEPIDQSNVDELKDLFVELCDEYNLRFEELHDSSKHGITGLLYSLMDDIDDEIGNTIVFGINNNYSDRHFRDWDGGNYDYVFFGIKMKLIDWGKSMGGIGSRFDGMKPIMKDIYNRILSMGYRCELKPFITGNKIIIIYKIAKDSHLTNRTNI